MSTDTLARFTDVTRYPDPVKRWALTARAMRLYLVCADVVSHSRRADYADWLETLPPVATEHDYLARLNDVRDLAEKDSAARGGSNCVEGTNVFLQAFNLIEIEEEEEEEEEETTKYVTVNVTITFRVENTADTYDTQRDVENYLRVDAGGHVDDMSHIDAEIDNVTVELAGE